MSVREYGTVGLHGITADSVLLYGIHYLLAYSAGHVLIKSFKRIYPFIRIFMICEVFSPDDRIICHAVGKHSFDIRLKSEGNTVRTYSIPVVIIIPDLGDGKVDLLRLVCVGNGKGVKIILDNVTAVSIDRILFKRIFDLFSVCVSRKIVERKAGPGILGSVSAAGHGSDPAAVRKQINCHRLRTNVILIAGIVPHLREVHGHRLRCILVGEDN